MFPVSAAVLALALAQAAPAPAAEPDRLRRTDIPIALVLSGGVSLGSYEAGLSWAVVRFSRDASSVTAAAGGAPRLLAVTGASAGSVNALLSAILWCTEPGSGEDSIDHNLLHDLWLSVGLDGLLPDRSDGYLPGDALMSTRPLLDGFHQFELRVSAAAAARRFRPGCRLPIGLTVTRASAAEHEVGGLRLRTQRFELTWRLEVGPDGVPRVVPQRLGEQRPDVLDIAAAGGAELGTALSWPQAVQAMLASAAFPLAFRARELCDCSTRCPLENQVKTGTCEGPLGPMTNLSCPARSSDGEPLTLCSHRYVDGGIFDNTPVGLGVELTQSMATTQPLQPVTYVYIDPDLRRLTPAASPTPAAPATPGARALRENLEDLARIASELVATARTEDLSRTLRAGPWNVTTRDLLYETAASLTSFATVERDVAARLGQAGTEPAPALGEVQPSAALRGPLGRALLRCFPERPPDPPAERACARELADVLAGRVPPGDASPPTEEEVIRLAEAMRRAANEMLLRGRPTRSVQGAELFAHRMRVGAVGMTFLADEMTRVARSATPEPVLKQFRGALLDTIQLGRAYGVEAAHQANAAVLDQLAVLRADPAAAAAATQASATILAAPDVVFVPDELDTVLNTTPRTAAARQALRAIIEIAGVAPLLQNEIVRLGRFAREAQALALQQTRAERALILSSRFAPITGSQLGHFGAFLDRPFREYDYIAGVYDASRAIAVRLCEAEAIPGAPRAVRSVRSSNQLDLHALDTQRCVGTALRTVFRALDVESSGTAAHVFRTLARTELDASLDAADAARLAAEPAWAWVKAPARSPPDPAVATVADVLLSPRVECVPGATSSCIRELTFDEFLSALRARNYEPTDLEMRALVEDPDAWTRRTLRRLVDRSYERELARPASPDLAPAILAAHGVGEMWLRGRSAVGPFPQLRLDPSTIPPRMQTTSLDARRVVAHLVPYRIDLDVARGGVSVSWLDPTLWLGPRASLALEVTPISYASDHGRFSSSLALLPTLHVAGLAVGAGPKGTVQWSDGGTTAGALLRVAAFQQRLSVSVGADSFSAGGNAVFVTVGVADLNGAFFWLLGG